MQNNEKDEYIRKIIQKDTVISKQAEDIFNNMKYENKKEHKSHKTLGWITTIAATFVVVTVSSGLAVLYNEKDNNINNVVSVSEQHITPSTPSSSQIIVLNEEIKADEAKITKTSENDSIKAILYDDNKVGIQLKEEYLKYKNWNLDTSKVYEVSQINKRVNDVFVGDLGGIRCPWIMMIMSDSTVECVQVDNASVSKNNEIRFFNQGKIEGLSDIVKFEQQSEQISGSDNMAYYIYAIRKDGVKKSIEPGKYNDMGSVSTNEQSFTSQDGENKYTIEAKEGDYVVAYGWAGASNNVYYINDECLYHLSLVDGTKTKLVTGVSSIRTDDSGQIVVKMNYIHTIHKFNQYITLEESTVTDAKVVKTTNNNNMEMALKEDGSITVEVKLGGLKELGAENTFIKERIRYNFYVKGYTKKNKVNGDTIANATAIYMGNIGTRGLVCLAYATEDNKVVTIDILELMKKSQGLMLDVSGVSIISQGDYPSKIKDFEKGSITIKLQDGIEKKCDTVSVLYDNGRKAEIPISIVLMKEGYSNYTVVNEVSISE